MACKKTLDKKTLNQSASRKPRADALRNRDRVLEAARAVFSAAGGPEASLEAVARTRQIFVHWCAPATSLSALCWHGTHYSVFQMLLKLSALATR